MKFSSENEIQARMKLSCAKLENFKRSSENDFFQDLGPYSLGNSGGLEAYIFLAKASFAACVLGIFRFKVGKTCTFHHKKQDRF